MTPTTEVPDQSQLCSTHIHVMYHLYQVPMTFYMQHIIGERSGATQRVFVQGKAMCSSAFSKAVAMVQTRQIIMTLIQRLVPRKFPLVHWVVATVPLVSLYNCAHPYLTLSNLVYSRASPALGGTLLQFFHDGSHTVRCKTRS